MRPFLVLGSLSAALAVSVGAFGAHALRARLDTRALEIWETAARYQMYHALALILVAMLLARTDGHPRGDAGASRAERMMRASGWAFVAGTLVFPGSLYAMALTGITALGAITPVGGVCFIAGWLLLAVAGWGSRAGSA